MDRVKIDPTRGTRSGDRDALELLEADQFVPGLIREGCRGGQTHLALAQQREFLLALEHDGDHRLALAHADHTTTRQLIAGGFSKDSGKF
ncbi:MAG: hypothetical protein BWY75_01175 [bacterium ADurb.Bin425]|nr:MAG: hypothetical protein BWY75_01175 [bacterium ADurb.Bin425]